MKNNWIVAIMAVALLTGGVALGQNGQGRRGQGQGQGYGGPPQTQEERAARQAARQEKNGAVCPVKGGKQCTGQGPGAGKGLRDGTGPRSATGNCPLGKK